MKFYYNLHIYLTMENRLVKIGEAAKLLGTAISTLRRWEETGELLPARKTKGGTRFYAVSDLLGLQNAGAPTVCYARVSSHDKRKTWSGNRLRCRSEVVEIESG